MLASVVDEEAHLTCYFRISLSLRIFPTPTHFSSHAFPPLSSLHEAYFKKQQTNKKPSSPFFISLLIVSEEVSQG